MSTQYRILVVGLGAGGVHDLPATLWERIETADVLAGGARQLDALAGFAGEKLTIAGDIVAVIEQLQRAYAAGRRVVVLASGDPLCYGIGASLRRAFAADALDVVPAPTAFQLAFAALAEPWHDAALLSVHARPLTDVVHAVMTARIAAVLTDREHTPSVLAQALIEQGMTDDSACAVCENLGYDTQRIVRGELAAIAEQTFAALNVFVVWGHGHAPHPPGLPDTLFSTEAGLITRREVRLLSLAKLQLAPGKVLWDIGAGSGAVSIEAARSQPTMQVYAIERRTQMITHIRKNMRCHPAPNVRLIEGNAPHACNDLPNPHAVFIGGSGGHLVEIIAMTKQRILPGGCIVINLVTLENIQIARDYLPDARVVQLQVNQGVPIGQMVRFEACNPIFIVTWRKPCD